MKKIVSIMLVAIMLFSFAACNQNTPEKALDNIFRALKDGDLTTLNELQGNEGDTPEMSDGDKEMYKALYGNFSYKIGKATVEGDKAKVEVDMSIVDMSKVMGKIIEEALKHVDEPDWDYEAYMKEVIGAKDVAKKDFNVTVPMELKEGKWIIDKNGEIAGFVNALTGGMMQASSDIGGIFG